MDGPIARILRAARDAWPDLAIAEADYEAYVVARLEDGAGWEAVNGPDLYLACGCARGERAAIRAFEEHHMTRVPGYLSRTASVDAAAVDEVCQLVRVRVLAPRGGAPPRIAEYSGRGSLAAWLRVVTLRIHANLRRSAEDAADSDALDVAASVVASPELAVIRARYKDVVERALKDAVARLDSRERAVFRLCYVDGLALERVGAIYGVHKSTVSRWLASARERVVAMATDRLRADVEMARDELESLVGMFASQIELSLDALLKTA